MDGVPIVGTITVTHSGPQGVTAIVGGTPTHFLDIRALFSAVVRGLEQIPTASDVRLDPDHERSRP